jgi:hypothetical protein
MAGKTFICSYTISLIREAGEEFDTGEIGKFPSMEHCPGTAGVLACSL